MPNGPYPRNDSSCREMLAAIEVSKGLEMDLGATTPFYAFVCCDLVTDLNRALTDKRELFCTIRPRALSNMGKGYLAVMHFDYSPDGVREMFDWVQAQKTRKLCSNAHHRWCKLALKDYHLCSLCPIREAVLGGAAKTPAKPNENKAEESDPEITLNHDFFNVTSTEEIPPSYDIWSRSSSSSEIA